MSPMRAALGREAMEAQGFRRLLVLDAALLLWARGWEKGWLTGLMRALTGLGDTATWLMLALVLAFLGGPGAECARLLAGGALVALVASQSLKRLCRRPRPTAALDGAGFAALTENPDAFSFPSGHTAVAFAVAAALVGQGELAWVLFPVACGIGVSRVYLGAHYPLDVVVGAVLGMGCGTLARGPLDGPLGVVWESLAASTALIG